MSKDIIFKPAKKREPAPPGDITCGLVTFREVGYVFEITTGRPGETYDIQAATILTNPSQFTDWVWQLHQYGWITGQHFADLFDCMSEVIYRTYDVWPQTHYVVEGAIAENPKAND